MHLTGQRSLTEWRPEAKVAGVCPQLGCAWASAVGLTPRDFSLDATSGNPIDGGRYFIRGDGNPAGGRVFFPKLLGSPGAVAMLHVNAHLCTIRGRSA